MSPQELEDCIVNYLTEHVKATALGKTHYDKQTYSKEIVELISVALRTSDPKRTTFQLDLSLKFPD